MWKSLIFDCWCGDKIWKVDIGHAQGGADGYGILINNWNEGFLTKYREEWILYPSPRSVLTGDDIRIIVDMIEEWEEK